MKVKTVDEFITEIAAHYPGFTEVKNDLSNLKNTKFNKNECLFVWDVRLGEILFIRGFHDLLGFIDDEINLERFTNLFHPDEKEFILKLGQMATFYTVENPKSNKEFLLYVSHRIMKSDGSYAKILAQSSPFSWDDKGLINSFLVRLTDIGFIDPSELVQYKFETNGLDYQAFHDRLFADQKPIFSPRELEVIQEIDKGHSNPQIAKNLVISKHTVATHRKKILKKSGCHSADELLVFCRKNGVL